MPWKEKTIKMERREFVERALLGIESKSQLCREYGISRPTGDKWIQRFQETGELDDKSHVPQHQPRRTPEETEQRIIEIREQYPFMGARKIHRYMEKKGQTELPCPSTINKILSRNGLITPEASAAATPYKRFVMAEPNDMWQTDYKGHFPMKDGNECHPLNILDDHSRYVLCSRAMPNERFETFQPVLIELFIQYGMPKYFLSDNGNPWGSGLQQGYSRNDVWLMQLGVLPIHGRLHHPQTQGKDESFNRSLERECLRQRVFENEADVQAALDWYRNFYNTERPHHALNLDMPQQHYTKSKREYCALIEPWVYREGLKTINIHGKGHFRYNGHDYYLGEAFAGETIAIRESAKPGYMTLEYRKFRIARINLEKKVLENKRARLLKGDPRSK